MNRGRGNRRGRGNGAQRRIVASAVRAVENRDLRWRVTVPPLRQPSVNRNFTFPCTVVSHQFSGTLLAQSTIRVEDVITAVAKTVSMTSSWYSLLNIRVQEVYAYAQITATTDLAPSFTLITFDPITENPVKSTAAIGTIDAPARTATHYPVTVNETALGWDGIVGTSAVLAVIKSNDTLLLSVYFRLVVIVDDEITIANDDRRYPLNHGVPREDTPDFEFMKNKIKIISNFYKKIFFLSNLSMCMNV